MQFFVTKSVCHGSFVSQIASGIARLKVITMVLDVVQLVNYFFFLLVRLMVDFYRLQIYYKNISYQYIKYKYILFFSVYVSQSMCAFLAVNHCVGSLVPVVHCTHA